MIPEIKTDPERPHHYIIAVEMAGLKSKDAGKLGLRFQPVHFTNDDVLNVRRANQRVKDKLFSVTLEEALTIENCSEVVHTLNIIYKFKDYLELNLYHFSSEEKIDNEWFYTLVESANYSKHTKELLDHAKIG